MPEEKKRYLLRILKNIKGERSPQRYLKKIVIFYREASTNVTCADELLYIYEYLIVELIKQKLTR